MFVYMSMCLYLNLNIVYIKIMFCLSVHFLWADLIALCHSVPGFSFVFFCCFAHIYKSKSVYLCPDNLCAFLFFYRRHTLEQLEMRHSDVRKELVTLKEALSQLTLQKEVLEDEKSSLAQALSRVLLYTFTQKAHLLTRPLIHSSIYSPTHLFHHIHSPAHLLIHSLHFYTLTHSFILPTLSFTNIFFQNTLQLTLSLKPLSHLLPSSLSHTFIHILY